MSNINYAQTSFFCLGLMISTLIFNQAVQAGVSSQSPSETRQIRQVDEGDIVRAKKLDFMFAKLEVANNEPSARRIERAIWQLWLNPDDRVVKKRMQIIMATRETGNYEETITLLNDLIAQYPNYSEGWNQRATIYYLMGNFDASVLDVAQTLKLEPRHFGALSGLAVMLWKQGNQDLARKSLSEAVLIHPFLSGRGMFDE
ncbi:MAG: tetratricopeptide (TPR) repeat protein [Gammaproteobacteria bacterium]|jgi:tetratricopeptide (TPR) repeat protein